jgi:hypothetical protein
MRLGDRPVVDPARRRAPSSTRSDRILPESATRSAILLLDKARDPWVPIRGIEARQHDLDAMSLRRIATLAHL